MLRNAMGGVRITTGQCCQGGLSNDISIVVGGLWWSKLLGESAT